MRRHRHIRLRNATIAVLFLPLIAACAGPGSRFDASATEPASTTDPASATTPASTIDVAATTDPASATDPYIAFLRQYGWTPQGGPDIRSATLPPPDAIATTSGPPWNIYLEVSRAIGLDFTSWGGQTLPLRVYALGREPNHGFHIRGYLLIGDQRVIGAWIDVQESVPGLFPLNSKPEMLIPK